MVLDYNTEIEMLLFDQDKIVTYKQLTHKFNITPAEAKCLLNKYVNKRDGNNIYVTYLVIYEDKETKKKRINLVNEFDLSSLLENANILSKQIYSVQTKQITDFNLFFSNDLDASNNLDRKSNIEVIYRESNNLTNKMEIDTDEDIALIQAEKITSAKANLTTSISENIENKKPTSIKEEPKQAANKTVKEEPREIEIKKPKLNEETNKTTGSVAKKFEPKKSVKPAQQSTLTSFFKKA